MRNFLGLLTLLTLMSLPAFAQGVSDRTEELKIQQRMLLELQHEKELRAVAEKARDGWKQQATDWQGLYESERQRAEILKSATEDRKSAGESQGLAVNLLREQVNADAGEIKDLRADIRACQAKGFRNTILGFGVGVGTGMFMKR